jgi:hypothetical protein
MTNATKSTTATWMVEYSNHDMGCPDGHMLRKTASDAKRAAKLMKECGYNTTSYRQWTK